ncbi:MAG: hypothetical protein ABR567_03030 [Myxococcales bacterium]|nr:hypothetical protein [Myxococcales bacterium]
MKRIVWLCVAACSSGPGISVPADRPPLSFTGTSATDANKAALPKGFTTPDEHACAADITRVYLGELFVNGLANAQVLWHWAPIVSGAQPAQPTLNQPEFSVAGTLRGVDDSGDDVLADHPFGLDVDADLEPDPPYAFIQFDSRTSTTLHTEVENRIFPRAALGYSPAAGDRALMRGVWVLDCGHPPYGAEMHPPTFTAYSRAVDAKTTIAAAVVMPYRSSLLFSGDVGAAVAIDNTARFGAAKPFPFAMLEAVQTAVLTKADHITTHALMTANRFDPLDFLVCAPLPKPAGASMDASWRLTARSGVKLDVTRIDSSGCVRVQASMDSTYKAMPLTYKDDVWTWQALSDSASTQLGSSIDVRQAILDNVSGLDPNNPPPSLQADHPPHIDAYAALATRPGADQDSPVKIDLSADDQPYPFYGRLRVAWK